MVHFNSFSIYFTLDQLFTMKHKNSVINLAREKFKYIYSYNLLLNQRDKYTFEICLWSQLMNYD